MPEHHAVDANVFRGMVSFRTTRTGRALFLDVDGRQVRFDQAPTIQLTLTDSTLAPAWKSRFLKDPQGRFIGVEIMFSSVQAGQVVEWVASR